MKDKDYRRLSRHIMPEPNSGCWLWTAGLNGHGYATAWLEGKTANTLHRQIYEHHKGPIPTGLVIDHRCRIPSCVNPDHMEPVTVRENTLRGIGITAALAARTHCKNGHPYEGQNGFIKSGRIRGCRVCASNWTKRYAAKLRRERGISRRKLRELNRARLDPRALSGARSIA